MIVKYDELKEKLPKAETQKSIIRDQKRGDIEVDIAPKEVWTKSVTGQFSNHTDSRRSLYPSSFVIHTICENLIIKQRHF